MSLSANISPSGCALAGNPIRLNIVSSSLVTYTIKNGGKDVFAGSGEGSFSIFLQDIINSLVSPAQAYEEDQRILIPCSDDNTQIEIALLNKEGESKTVMLNLYSGGVSKRALRRLNDDNTNIFTLKLLNSSVNFFRTTRTSSNVIVIKERELKPLHFFYPDAAIKVVAGGSEYPLVGTMGKSYALNIGYLRNQIFSANNEIVSTFQIYSGSNLVTTIIIERSELSRENYTLEFVNSYGAYERLELFGDGEIKRGEVEEDEGYEVYDDVVDDYVKHRNRTQGRDELIVETGIIDKQKIAYLLDCLASDNVKLLGLAGRNITVIPTADNLALAARATKPISIKLKLKLTDTEQYYSGDLSNLDTIIDNSRIHTDEFNLIFN